MPISRNMAEAYTLEGQLPINLQEMIKNYIQLLQSLAKVKIARKFLSYSNQVIAVEIYAFRMSVNSDMTFVSTDQ